MGDLEEVERVQAGIGEWLRRMARSGRHELRGIPASAVLPLLCAAAFGPALADACDLTVPPRGGVGEAAPQDSATVVARIGVLASVGASALGELLAGILERARSAHPSADLSRSDLQREIARSVKEALSAADPRAGEVRSDLAMVLREIDAGGTLFRTAIEAGDQDLQHEVLAAVEAVSSEFGEMEFLLADLSHAAEEIQDSLSSQGAELRAASERVGRQSADVRMAREELVIIEQRTRRWLPGSAGQEPSAPRWADGCPYRGLLSYGQAHAPVFFGRDLLVADIVRVAVGHHQEGQEHEPEVPGAAARLVLIIDQFEEIFAGPAEEGKREQASFIDAVCAAATRPAGPCGEPPALVVIAVRADYWDRCAAYERPQVDAALEAFVGLRLLALDADRVQIAHDVVLQAWPRLRGWLEEDQTSVILYGQLAEDTARWRANGDDSSLLYRGVQLAATSQAVRMWEADPARYPALTAGEAEFLRASGAAKTRARRRHRALAGLVALVVIAALAAAGIAVKQARTTADQQRTTDVAQSLAGQSMALDATDPVMASLLAAAAWRLAPTAQARYSLLQSLAQPVRGVLTAPSGVVTAMAYSPDGSHSSRSARRAEPCLGGSSDQMLDRILSSA